MPKTEENSPSIFHQYYADTPFYDRFAKDPKDAVDIIIPIVHTNELWEANLKSLYREVPVNRLLISDGGCIDNSVAIAKKFPRVKIFDHKKIKSLGYCIRKLVEAVETEWFIYPHSDVYLPKGWFETMKKHQPEYDWFGCPMRMTVLAEYDHVDHIRPYAGSQMGKKLAFLKGLKNIDDDYVYRQEDFVFARVVEDGGGKVGAIEDTFHYHQMMHKPSPFARKIKGVNFYIEMAKDEEIRTADTQARGVVKYLKPNRFQRACLEDNLIYLIENKQTSLKEFREWARKANPEWNGWIKPQRILFGRIRNRVIAMIKKTFDLLMGNGR